MESVLMLTLMLVTVVGALLPFTVAVMVDAGSVMTLVCTTVSVVVSVLTTIFVFVFVLVRMCVIVSVTVFTR